MKSIILGDIHGRTIWSDIVRKEEDADEVVFIGDYFDSKDSISAVEQIANFKAILEFKNDKEAQGKKVTLLIGNHDFHYLSCAHERYSGFQKGTQYSIQAELEPAVRDGKLQMAYVSQDFLFTHAGVTKMWCKNNGVEYQPEVYNRDLGAIGILAAQINHLFRSIPSAFRFRGTDPYGDDIIQSPIWVRPISLMDNSVPFKQVVGHTTMGRINPEGAGHDDTPQFWFIDTLGTSKEYLVIEDGITRAGKA